MRQTWGGKIIFLHYKSFEEAAEAWYRRVKRINWNNLYFVLVERDGCTHEDLKCFDNLPYSHKIALVHRPYKDIKCSFYIRGYEERGELGNIMVFCGHFGKRPYDQFNWINFLNK